MDSGGFEEYDLTTDGDSSAVRMRVYGCARSLASGAAEFILSSLETHKRERRFRIALSGGSTPRLMYASLASMPESAGVLTEKAEFFFSDERAVEPDHEDSNYATARKNLFEPLDLPDSIIHRMKGEATDLLSEATRYENLVREDTDLRKTPSLDLTILGMGSDGHTASLFPDHAFGDDGESLVIAPWVESKQTYRISFSMKLINASKQVLFMVAGSDKAPALAKVLSFPFSDDRWSIATLPASMVVAKSVMWMIDADAASMLDLNAMTRVAK